MEADPFVFPLAPLFDGARDDEAAELGDQFGLLRDVDERRRGEQAALRVLPADKCLNSMDFLAFEIDLRLVVDKKLAVCECLAQFRPHPKVSEVSLADLLVVHREAPVLVLCLRQCDARVTQHRVEIGTVFGKAACANTRPELDPDPTDLYRLGKQLFDGVAETRQLSPICPSDENREFVFAEARHLVGRKDRP